MQRPRAAADRGIRGRRVSAQRNAQHVAGMDFQHAAPDGRRSTVTMPHHHGRGKRQITHRIRPGLFAAVQVVNGHEWSV